MGNRFASGKIAIAQCDICDFRYKLKELRTLVVKTKNINLLVCRECWSPDHPQLQLGMFPVDDPQGLRNPRPDRSYVQGGPGPDGELTEGSRITQWGWAPVGFSNPLGLPIPDTLLMQAQLGTVTVNPS